MSSLWNNSFLAVSLEVVWQALPALTHFLLYVTQDHHQLVRTPTCDQPVAHSTTLRPCKFVASASQTLLSDLTS